MYQQVECYWPERVERGNPGGAPADYHHLFPKKSHSPHSTPDKQTQTSYRCKNIVTNFSAEGHGLGFRTNYLDFVERHHLHDLTSGNLFSIFSSDSYQLTNGKAGHDTMLS